MKRNKLINVDNIYIYICIIHLITKIINYMTSGHILKK